MRLSSLVVAAVLLVPAVAFAQHSSAAVSSSGSSSGGSHSSYSGGASAGSSSSNAHSSGGTSPSGHSSGGSSSGSSNKGSAAHRQIENIAPAGSRNPVESARNSQPERKGFIGFLRHPFAKANPKLIEAERRQPVCKNKSCACPPGEIHGKSGGCVASVTLNDFARCQAGEYWYGGGCAALSLFRSNDCSNLAFAVKEQARKVEDSDSSRQSSCSGNATTQECSDRTTVSQNEAAHYKSLQQEYEQCRTQQYSSTSHPGYQYYSCHRGYSFGGQTVNAVLLEGLADPSGVR